MTRHIHPRRLAWLAATVRRCTCSPDADSVVADDSDAKAPVAEQQENESSTTCSPRTSRPLARSPSAPRPLPALRVIRRRQQDDRGLDPDLGQALGEVLGVEVEFTHTAFDGLLTAARRRPVRPGDRRHHRHQGARGRVRLRRLLHTGQSIVVKKGNPPASTASPTCAASRSRSSRLPRRRSCSASSTRTSARATPSRSARFPSDRDALVQVQTGRSEAAFTQDAVGAYNAKNIGGGNPVRDRQLRGPAAGPGRDRLRQGGHPAARRLPGCAEGGHRQRRLRRDPGQVGHERWHLQGRHHQRG